jgi:hypothetical protein
MNLTLQKPWTLWEGDFPAVGTTADKLRFMLNYAVLAPSSHNSQPWLFDIAGKSVDIYADRTQCLPVVDPLDRELKISCGAALFFLRIATRHFGYTDVVELLPDSDRPDLLARVRLGGPHEATKDEQVLFDAIPRRHTNRKPFQERELPVALPAALSSAAEKEGAHLRFVDDPEQRKAVGELIGEADRAQWADKRFRHELAAWVRTTTSTSYDGVQSNLLDMGDLNSYAIPHVIRNFDLGSGQASKDRDSVADTPALVILGTDGDTPEDWVIAGQALARVLLRAAVEGVTASYLNQPIQIQPLRETLSVLTGAARYPQVMLRMGYGENLTPTPRRDPAIL